MVAEGVDDGSGVWLGEGVALGGVVRVGEELGMLVAVERVSTTSSSGELRVLLPCWFAKLHADISMSARMAKMLLARIFRSSRIRFKMEFLCLRAGNFCQDNRDVILTACQVGRFDQLVAGSLWGACLLDDHPHLLIIQHAGTPIRA